LTEKWTLTRQANLKMADLERMVEQRTWEIHTLQEELLQVQKIEAIGRLAGGIAHDFNNLLTIILGNGEFVLEQVAGDDALHDLCVNAHYAQQGGGSLSIETRNVEVTEVFSRTPNNLRPGPYVIMTVSDTGCGMEEHIKSKVFEPFFTTKPRGKGTGMGLATVHGIVRQSEGHIEFTSELGQGTEFTIYLPSVSADVQIPQHRAV